EINMTLDKIEVNYPRAILRYKIKYSESRKPTYVEFILLKILISYGDKDQILQRVIEGELGIKNSSLFQRALTDLINFDIVKVKKNISEQDFNAILNIKISELKVSPNIERKFVSGDFMM